MEFIRDGLLALLEILMKLSLQGSFCILLVLLARFLLRKAPKWCSYVLWSVVFLRLICPVFPEGSFSLMPRQLQISRELVLEQVQADVERSDSNQNDVLQESTQSHVNDALINNESVMTRPDTAYAGALNTEESFNEDVQGQVQNESVSDRNTVEGMFLGMAIVWLLGAIAFAAHHIISYQLLKHRMKIAVETQEGVFEVQGEHLSFVMGIVNPKIYLSSGLDAETRKVILCHERVHLQRRDYIVKPLALGICCVHWWNPLVWLAFYLMNKDCEMSCDERVVALMGEESKAVYSYALLSEATRGEYVPCRRRSVCALLSFGEDHVKNRISHVLKYKRASIAVVCLAVLVLVVLGVGLCFNPKEDAKVEEATDTLSKEQEALLAEMAEELNAQQEALLKELEATKKEEALKAEQEALREELEKVEKEQQEIERLEQELTQKKQHNAREIYDSCEVGDVTYQLTNLGIYKQDSEGVTFLYPAYAADTAKLAYDDGKLYFPTDSSYYPGALDWWDDSIAVLDVETLMMNYIKLPQSAHSVFPLGGFYVRDGYISMWQEGAAQSYCMLLEDVLPVYNGKLATELSEDEKNAYGKKISEQVCGNSNQMYRVGLHTQSTTFAYLDLDRDGKVEEVRMSKHGIGYDAPMDSFILTAGEGKQNCSAMNQVNEIYAWSPDGERIFIVLYQDGPSGDPLSTFYRYEDNRLQEAGMIESDVRDAFIENGVISTVIRRDVIQTDGIRVQYRINERGEVELIEQETYDFTGLNDVELKEMLKLYAKPDGSLDMKIMMKPQTIHITKTDKNFEWVLIEGENGTQGWVRVKNILYVGDDEIMSGEIFDGLFFAG